MLRGHLHAFALIACALSGCQAPAEARPGADMDRADADMADGGDGAVGDATPASDGDDTPASDGGDLSSGDANAPGDAGGSYRSSLSVCWTDATCPRVMAVGHGGLWSATSVPYDSDAALAAAYAAGMDGVKIDVRVTADNVPVIAHSSPIEIYESLDCYNQRIEEMTAAQVTACHRVPSSTETFQRLDDVLEYLRGKMVAQLTVKESTDYGRTIEMVLALGAEDFAFLEISTGELQTLVPTLPGSDQVYYLINVASNLSEVDTLLDVVQNPRAFMVEFDPDAPIGDLISTRLHPAGIRAFTYDSSQLPSTVSWAGYYAQGYDVISTNLGDEVVAARIIENQSRGVDPP